MKAKRQFIENGWGGAIGAVLAAALGVTLLILPLGRGLVDWSYDLPFALRPVLHPDEAVLVLMDDESHDKLAQPFNRPWDRRLHARMIDRLTAAGAKAIVMDIVFSDPAPDPEEDPRMAEAMRHSGRVVLAADTVPAGYGEDEVNMRMVTMPTDVLRDQTARFASDDYEGVGSAEMVPSQDFVIRRHFHGSKDDVLPSMSWVTAKFLQAEVSRDEVERTRPRWVNYYGPSGTVPNVSYFRALDPTLSSDALFRDRVVFIGARLFTVFSGQRKDEFRTPYSYWRDQNKFMPGVEVQATLLLNLLRGDWLNRGPVPLELICLLLAGLLIGFLLAQLRPLTSTLVALGSILAVSGAAYALFRFGSTWFPWLLVVVQIAVAWLWSLLFNTVQLYVEKRVLEQSLALHLSPSRVKQLMGHPDLLKPGAEKQLVSILFSDIADFTKISEGMDSDQLARLMNNYFEVAIARIHETDGMVVKLIGDAIFAVWNAPLAQEDHRARACQAALKLRDQVAQFLDRRTSHPLMTRIGLHTGLANVGNFGSASRFDYTAIGESINLASRMEGLNKHLGTSVLATRETQLAVADHLDSRLIGHFRLKGFEKAVEVHELMGPVEQVESTRPVRDYFAKALKHFQNKAFFEAKDGFIRTLELLPNDGPSLFYIATLSEMLPEFLPDDWRGEIILREK